MNSGRCDANLPRRSYALGWRQATATEAIQHQNINNGDYLCYWYSEDDWYGSDAQSGQPHMNFIPIVISDPRVINCNNGQVIN